MRTLLLFLSENRQLKAWSSQSQLAQVAARRFVSGESIEHAITAIHAANQRGLMATLDHLGEIERLERVSRRFLSFARPEPMQAEPLDLRAVARRVQDLVGADARAKGVHLEVQVGDEPVTVTGDRDLLAQVALNIALNGLRAVDDRGGTIRISVGPAEHQGRPWQALVIENDGPQLDPVEMERLFDPFTRGEHGGVGLGLSISARIAQQHSGYIEAENAGLGVRFTVYLPPGAG